MDSEQHYRFVQVNGVDGSKLLYDAEVATHGGYLSIEAPDGRYGWQEGEWRSYVGSDDPAFFTFTTA